ncbi:MAG: T9SS type A sorting domain-containing protein [Bacteroidales bacterium]|nr:T9SS type A sorting domain-containing protein [Bacteroidales bacterium]
MKKYITILFLMVGIGFLVQKTLTAQTISYTYDACGNRIERKVISLLKSGHVTDTVKSESYKQETFEDQLGEQKILIYPNPVKEDIKIEFQGKIPEISATVFLYNQTGKLMKSQVVGQNTSLNINLSGYPAGIYILRLSMQDKVSEWKIIKE